MLRTSVLTAVPKEEAPQTSVPPPPQIWRGSTLDPHPASSCLERALWTSVLAMTPEWGPPRTAVPSSSNHICQAAKLM